MTLLCNENLNIFLTRAGNYSRVETFCGDTVSTNDLVYFAKNPAVAVFQMISGYWLSIDSMVCTKLLKYLRV